MFDTYDDGGEAVFDSISLRARARARETSIVSGTWRYSASASSLPLDEESKDEDDRHVGVMTLLELSQSGPEDLDYVSGEDEEDDDDDGDDGDVVLVPSAVVPELEKNDANALDNDDRLSDFDSKSDVGDDLDEIESVPVLSDSDSDSDTPEYEGDDEEQELILDSFVKVLGGSVAVADGKLDRDALRGIEWREAASTFDDASARDEYPSLSCQDGQPTSATRRRLADSPLSLCLSSYPMRCGSRWRETPNATGARRLTCTPWKSKPSRKRSAGVRPRVKAACRVTTRDQGSAASRAFGRSL